MDRQYGNISGRISVRGSIGGGAVQGRELSGIVEKPEIVKPPPYDGPYEVVPIYEDIDLETKEKYMENNVKVHAIPVHEVSNPQGGVTVTIGG